MDEMPLTTLPLDTPDDDPRWEGWLRQMRLGFVESEATQAQVRWFREFSRADQALLRAVADPDDALPDTPVATFGSVDSQLNLGAGMVRSSMITDVTVRASHRRRGLLTSLMTAELTQARERGCVVAALTASEGGIYGRFGFGVATRLAGGWIDAQRFQLRQPVTGTVAYATAETAEPHYQRLADELARTTRGGFGRMAFHPAVALGRYEWETGEADRKVRILLHRDQAGEVDGFASYRAVPDSDPAEIKVVELMGLTPAATLALWQFLVSLDLVERVSCRAFAVDDALPWALRDARAVRFTRIEDLLWLRVLDVPQALVARGWDGDGEIVLRVDDRLGLADGTWRVQVRDGRAEVAAADAEADVCVDVETLGSLLLGGVSPAALAAAGRIDGDAAGLGRLFAVATPPYTPVGF